MTDDFEPMHSRRGRGGHPGARRRFPGPGGFGGGPGPHPGELPPPHRFGRGGGRRQRGDVRVAILAILAEREPMNGYAIMKAIADRTEGAWRPSPGSIYPTLQQLVDEGLVDAAGAGRGTDYRLSDEGRSYAAEHADRLAGWADEQRPSDAARELMAAGGKLMGVLGQFRSGVGDDQLARAAQVLDDTRKSLYRILAE